MTKTTIRYTGTLRIGDWGEGIDILYLDEDVLAERIKDDIEQHGSYLSVRYFTSDAPSTWDEAQEGFVRRQLGEADARVGHAYSEVTGYLWTDEEIVLRQNPRDKGHDLIEELHGYVGKYLNLEIDFATSVDE